MSWARIVPMLLTGVVMLAGCSGGDESSQSETSSSTSSAVSATSSPKPSESSQKSSPGGDEPIGDGGIDLKSKAPSTSYPAEQLSGPRAGDCYAGGSRIYDRRGITCADAKKALATYEATAEGAKGASSKVGSYTCSHNPDEMVGQGAAPGSCLDDDEAVVFNWRYPGAVQPR